MNKQLEMDYTSSDAKTASQIGIRWTPNEATPEQINHWHETDSKWWAERGLLFVAIASFTQVFMLGMMGLTMYMIGLGVN